MGPYLGDYVEDATLDFIWDSNAKDGASITRATDGTISVYKANGTTQSVVGVTDIEDFDSLIGIHHLRIDLSADAFYVVGNDYNVVLSAATIDGEIVNAVLCSFSIENRFQEVDVIKWLGTAVNEDIAGYPKITIKDGTGQGEIALTNGKVDGVALVDTTTTNTDMVTEPPTAVQNRQEMDSNSTLLADIDTKTTNLPPDPADASDIAASHASISGLINGLNDITAADVWAVGTRTLTSFGTLIQDIWDKATSALTIVGSIGKLLVDNINATISSRSVAGDNMNLAADAITPAKYNDVAANIPYQGGIWVDSGAANANTVVGVDGLPSNPVSTFAAARTLADAIGMQKYYIINHSNLTLAATHQDWVFEGIGLRNRINMGGQDVNDSFFYHIILSGTQGGSQKIEAKCSYLNGITNLNIIATNVWLTGNNTLKATTLSIIDHWSSNVPGQSTPELTFQAGETSIGLRHGSGGIKVNNMTSDHTMSLETDGQLIVDATCNNGNISARGNMDITDNSANMNITKTAVWNTSQSIQSVTNDVGITQAGADKVNGPSGAVIPDISIGAPPSTPTPQQYRSTVWAALVNKAISDTSGAGEWKIFNSSGTLAAKGTIADGSSIFTRSRLGAPS